MSKTSNCIRMLMILSDGNVHSISELSEKLETNPRNIIEYRKELEDSGYPIIGVPGKFGGYKIIKEDMFPCLKLTIEERKALSAGVGYLKARKDFPEKKDFETAMEKVFCTENREVVPINPTVIARYPSSIDENRLRTVYSDVETAIKKQNKIWINYRSNDNVLRDRIIQPYKLYMYDNNWFVLAYCELVETFRYFKLCRMVDYRVLQDKFRRSLAYNEKEWLDKFGMTNNGDWYPVKLKFTGRFAMIAQDYLFGKDQTVEYIDSDTTIVTVKMQYHDNIIGFVLSCIGYCEVIEPEWLKDEVKSVAAEVSRLYD